MRTIPDPGFAGDDGCASPAVTAALTEVAAGAPLERAVAALSRARVLVPVVALPGDDTTDSADSAEMAAVLLTGRDGRRALLAFSSLGALHYWDPRARPVPVPMAQAAQAALADAAAAVVVDVAGPAPVPIEGGALQRLAAGQQLVAVDDGWAWTPVVAEPGSVTP